MGFGTEEVDAVGSMSLVVGCRHSRAVVLKHPRGVEEVVEGVHNREVVGLVLKVSMIVLLVFAGVVSVPVGFVVYFVVALV